MEKGEAEIHTSYLTSIDIWFVAMKTFSVMSLVESLIVLALIKRARGMVCFFWKIWMVFKNFMGCKRL
jgi:hypothetical protein